MLIKFKVAGTNLLIDFDRNLLKRFNFLILMPTVILMTCHNFRKLLLSTTRRTVIATKDFFMPIITFPDHFFYSESLIQVSST